MIWYRLRLTLEMIKFEHSIFALPFALTGALLALRQEGFGSPGIGRRLLWIVVAMVAARSAAMAFNRVIDAGIDARNPRTRSVACHSRRAPHSAIRPGIYRGVFLLLFFAAFELNRLCLQLAPLALAIVFFYSFTKRFTSVLAPASWIHAGYRPGGRLDRDPRLARSAHPLPTAAVTCWTAGFDVIYACQDYEFYREEGLWSVPRALGIAGALRVAKLLHLLMVGCLLALVYVLHVGPLAVAGVAAIVALLIYEHSLVKPTDLCA